MKCLNPCFVGKCSTSFQEKSFLPSAKKVVLILVLLENALRGSVNVRSQTLQLLSLNPCFVGKCSTSIIPNLGWLQTAGCLNPCFVGKCSTSKDESRSWTCQLRLNPCFVGKCSTRIKMQMQMQANFSLNPCFVGKCSTSSVWDTERNRNYLS